MKLYYIVKLYFNSLKKIFFSFLNMYLAHCLANKSKHLANVSDYYDFYCLLRYT